MLGRRNLIVLGLCQNSQLPKLSVQIFHKGDHSGLDSAEIMIVQLLPLRRHRAEEGSPGVNQIRPFFKHFPVDQEVLLFRSHTGPHIFGVFSEQLQNPLCLLVQRLHGAEQRRFLIQRVSRIGTESGRNTQGVVLDKCIGSGIPGRIASRLKSCPQPSGGEGRGVRLSLEQLFSAELHDDPAVRGRSDKTVMFLRRHACQRLEPVGKMSRAVFHRPVPHLACDCLSDILLQLRVFIDRFSQGLIYVRGQPRSHYTVIKHQRTK